jgi:peroxiredoxin
MALSVPFQQQVDDFVALQVSRLPAKLIEDLKRPIGQLIQSDAVAKVLKEGAQVPDFTLPDTHGQAVTLSHLLKQGPVVITFYRGVWCNFCNLELHAYQEIWPEIQALGASVIAISPQTPDNSRAMEAKQELTFPVLSDVGNKVARQFGLVFAIDDPVTRAAHTRIDRIVPNFNGDDSWELPMPGTFLVDQSGIIRLAFVNPDFTSRLDPESVVARLKEMPS